MTEKLNPALKSAMDALANREDLSWNASIRLRDARRLAVSKLESPIVLADSGVAKLVYGFKLKHYLVAMVLLGLVAYQERPVHIVSPVEHPVVEVLEEFVPDTQPTEALMVEDKTN